MKKEDEKDIALANFIESLNKANWWEIFSKKVTRWLQYRTLWKEKLRKSFLK